MTRPGRVLPVIIGSQFAGTSLWFAGNAVLVDLKEAWGLPGASVGYVTSAVQFGFIVGTLVFALLTLSDRFSPRRVFFLCASGGAAVNLLLLVIPERLTALLAIRFLTGMLLAGIYPVGMKIAASWYPEGLGRALGYLVGALVLGTAFPHLVRSLGEQWPWQGIIAVVSIAAGVGGLLMLYLVPDGPHLPRGSAFDPGVLLRVFGSPSFRASAFGYFGHMWELYAFWAFVPVWAAAYFAGPDSGAGVSLWTFAVIGSGFFGCAVGGVVSLRLGSALVARVCLATSGLCCLLSPIAWDLSPLVASAFFVVWGITVIGDSPQFSALNAANAPPAYVGSALTIVNCIGFLITIFSIELLNQMQGLIGERYLFLLLAPGPVLGLVVMSRKRGNAR